VVCAVATQNKFKCIPSLVAAAAKTTSAAAAAEAMGHRLFQQVLTDVSMPQESAQFKTCMPTA